MVHYFATKEIVYTTATKKWQNSAQSPVKVNFE